MELDRDAADGQQRDGALGICLQWRGCFEQHGGSGDRPAQFYRVMGSNGVASAPVPLLPNNLTQPLQVTQGTLQLLSSPVTAGNTRLVVTIAPGTVSSSNIITLLIGNTLTQLRDDGVFPDQVANDGNFSAVVNVKTSDLNALNGAITNQTNGQITDIFSGRALVATNSLVPFPTASFLAGEVVTIFNIEGGSGGGGGPINSCAGSPTAYDPAKTLMITDLSVVQDAARNWDPFGGGTGTKMGAWTFGKLITDMANVSVTGPRISDPAMTTSDFVLNWLHSYSVSQTINSDTVPAVPNVQSEILTPWQNATASEGGFPPGAVDVSIAPFRLLAIVNRLDLRANSTYGSTSSSSPVPQELAGEARFVFCAVDSSGNPLQMTVIFEYAVPNIVTCEQVQNWAQQWANLNTLALPSAAFNNALQALTDQFATAGANLAQFPNESAIAQVRVNDVLGSQWEVRQFNIPDGTIAPAGWLIESPVAATPAFTLNQGATLESFINTTAAAATPGTFCLPNTVFPAISIPAFYNSAPFLGGWAPEGLAANVFWASSTPSPLSGDGLCVRHVLSLNTCNACHTRETATRFVHVAPRAFNTVAALSAFLTGGPAVTDPYSALVGPYNYSDLARRVQDLNSTVICPCFMVPATFQPMPFVE